MEPPKITITIDAAAIGLICKEASEMTWMDKLTRERIIDTCKVVKRACERVGIKLEMGDGN